MSDANTTLRELKERMAAFVAEREWQQFHTPKNQKGEDKEMHKDKG